MSRKVLKTWFAGAAVILMVLGISVTALADPIVPGFTIEDYAFVDGPMEMGFALSGVLYVGRDISSSGTADPLRIHRIGLGGTPVEEYGDLIPDPDAVIFDATGWFSGTSGSVLVGGVGDGGSVRAILPDETTVLLWDSGLSNPTRMTFDNSGDVLFFSDPTGQKILRSDGGYPAGTPNTLVDTGNAVGGITVAPDGRIFTRVQYDDKIRIYDPNDGTLLDPSFATGLLQPSWETMAFGAGGVWGTDLFTISDGDLLRFDATIGSPTYGDSTVVGSGFDATPSDIVFGPDGALYVSMFDEDKILRIIPEPATVSLVLFGGIVALKRRR